MIRGALLAASVAAALRLPAPATAQQQSLPGAVCKASCAGPPPTSVIGFNKPITLYGYTQVVGTFYDSSNNTILPPRFGGAIVPSDVGCKSPLSQVLCQGERSDGQRPGGALRLSMSPFCVQCAYTHTRSPPRCSLTLY